MKLMCLAKLINHAFTYVVRTSKLYNIDESHALKHSMEVYNFANKIYESELPKNPFLEQQREIICTASILHDMCDKKYMSETTGIKLIQNNMIDYLSYNNLEVVSNIISTMSYSKVKAHGYPDLKEYQLAYHIVREADLLSAYDIDRCIIYGMYVEKLDYDKALKRAIELFESRVLKYRSDELFITQYSKRESLKMHKNAVKNLEFFRKQIDK